MRVTRESPSFCKFTTEIFKVFFCQSTFKKSTRIDTWGGVPLEIYLVTRIVIATTTDKVVQSNFVECCC